MNRWMNDTLLYFWPQSFLKETFICHLYHLPLCTKCLYYLTPSSIFSIILVFQEFLLKCAQVLFSWLLFFFYFSEHLKKWLDGFHHFQTILTLSLKIFPMLLSFFHLALQLYMLFPQIFKVPLISFMYFMCMYSHFLEFLSSES